MKEKILNPVGNLTSEVDSIEARIVRLLRVELYLPLLEVNDEKITNSGDALTKAIMAGRVTFYRGQFKGVFNASVTKELKALKAVWDREHGCFRLTLSKIPDHLKHAIRLSEGVMIKKLEAIDRRLKELSSAKIAEQLKVADLMDTSLYRVNRNIEQTLEKLTVMPTLTEEAREKLSKEYNQNMNLYIQDFAEEEIVKLRAKMENHIKSGGRYEDMIQHIQRRYEVSKSKAKFLARQETNLFMSKFKEARYGDAGIKEYIWRNVVGSENHPVRHSHKILNGKKFRFDDPPIVNDKGDRKNPGEDFGCRCTARPVVKF